MAARRARSWLGLFFALALGCNAIIGADPPTERTDSTACVLNSDCTASSTVCIFRVCSTPCRADDDCAEGSRCLKTEGGTACVANALAVCSAPQECPIGSSCTKGMCRNSCPSKTSCLGDQACDDGTCVGTNASHDPALDAGTSDASTEDRRPIVGPDAPVGPDASEGAAPDSPAAACTPNDRQCNGQQPQLCNSTGWVDDGQPCPFACGATGCVGACTPDAHRCSTDGLGTETCGVDGQWGTAEACPYVCSGGICSGECTPGTKQCSMTTPQTCGTDGMWSSGTACQNVCSKGLCAGACTPTDKQCSNLIPESCNQDGAWVDATPCSYVCSAGGCTGVCTPIDTQCTNGQKHICGPLGTWGAATPCTFVCSGKTCGGVCTPGDTLCPTDTQKEICGGDGLWGTESTCPNACVGKTCGGTCVPGSARCNVNTVQSCDTTGTWKDQTACSGGTPLCRSNQCATSSPYDIGNSAQLPNGTDQESANVMTVMEITVNYRTSLLRFGMWGRAGSPGPTPDVLLVIYAESTTTPGTPGALVMSSTPAALVAGNMEPPVAQSTNLAPGNYWIGAVFSGTANTWWSSTAGPTALWFNDTYPNTPNSFPATGVTSITGYTYNYYIVVQDY